MNLTSQEMFNLTDGLARAIGRANAAEEELTELKDAIKAAKSPHKDEQHCSCCALLRSENTRLQNLVNCISQGELRGRYWQEMYKTRSARCLQWEKLAKSLLRTIKVWDMTSQPNEYRLKLRDDAIAEFQAVENS